ncbi:universal stress protein [Fulvivirgaceae bacterium BMA10]|uniref:Universal stress protein n=1 Tax=Splendidivirga corallicola TaxID=3051826 RepID=A0ABT8KX68_9BACT|nr:universal stress protein [Fulvivirgaceae bacterium BMA10]
MTRKVMIAVDGSECANQAALKGFELARQLDASIALIYVIDKGKSLGNIEAGTFPMEALEAMEKEAMEAVQAIQAKAKGLRTELFTPEGDPKRDILNTAMDWGADMIIVGSRGHSALEKLILGSVSEYLLHHSTIPVMVVPSLTS